MEKLIVKHFAAIQNIEVQLKDLTVFIGKTGTGKSTLAKLVAIFRSVNFWEGEILNVKFFQSQLAHYQIVNFLKPDTYIEYQSDIGFCFTYNKGEIHSAFSENILNVFERNAFYNINSKIEEGIHKFLNQLVPTTFNEVIYLPAERSVVSFLSEKYAALDKEKLISLFPKTLLDFTGTFNRISSLIKQQHIGLFDVTYQKENGKDYIILSNDKRILLSESASGLQAVIPALIVFEYFSHAKTKKTYIFEEPELNLFPVAQKDLIEFLAEKVLSFGHKIVLTTHSPYIPTSINNLLFASQIVTEYPNSKEKILEISGLSSFISEISLYDLSNDDIFSVNLIDNDTGLIPNNELDSASYEILELFNNLMSVYRDFNRTTQ